LIKTRVARDRLRPGVSKWLFFQIDSGQNSVTSFLGVAAWFHSICPGHGSSFQPPSLRLERLRPLHHRVKASVENLEKLASCPHSVPGTIFSGAAICMGPLQNAAVAAGSGWTGLSKTA